MRPGLDKSESPSPAPGAFIASQGIEGVVTMLADPRNEGRAEAIRELAKAPIAITAPALEALVQIDTLEARSATLEVLRDRPSNEQRLEGIWSRLATSPQRDTRAQALETAARLAAIRAAELLPLWSQDKDLVLRRRSLTRLRLTGQQSAADVALKCTDDKDPTVRLEAIRILAEVPLAEAIPTLSKLAREKSPECRAAAFEALQKQSPFNALVTAAAIQREGKGGAALDALNLLGRFDSEKTAAAIRDAASGRVDLEAEPDPEIMVALLARISHDALDDLARRTLPDWLRAALIRFDEESEPGNPYSLRRLTKACSVEDEKLQELAVTALERHDREAPGQALGPLLKHERPVIRRMAVEGLVRSGATTVRLLRDTLKDPDVSVREATFKALAELIAEDAVRIWSLALADKSTVIRALAVERLIALPDEDEIQAQLTKAALDQESRVRAPAVEALVERGVTNPDLGSAYRDTLADALDPEFKPPLKSKVIVALIKLVAEMEPVGALGTLVGAARHKNALVRRTSADEIMKKGGKVALEAFALLADTEDPGILKRVVTVLGDAKDKRGLIPVVRAQEEIRGAKKKIRAYLDLYPEAREINFLLRALKMKWPSVKRFSCAELLKHDDPKIIPPLLKATKDENVDVQLASVQALGKFAKEEPVYKRLIEILDYGDVSVRQQAAETLGEYQIKEAVEPLIRFLTNPFLKHRVEEALMRIGDRKGYLAVKRRKIRDRLFGKKKKKGAIEPVLRKGKQGLGIGGQQKGPRR